MAETVQDVVNRGVTMAHTAPAIAATSTKALEVNPSRVYALLVNDSDTVMYVNIGATAVINTGIRLNANGGSLELSRLAGNLSTAVIYAIHGGVGNKTLLVTEGV